MKHGLSRSKTFDIEPLLIGEKEIKELLDLYAKGTHKDDVPHLRKSLAKFRISRVLRALETYMKNKGLDCPFQLEGIE